MKCADCYVKYIKGVMMHRAEESNLVQRSEKASMRKLNWQMNVKKTKMGEQKEKCENSRCEEHRESTALQDGRRSIGG